MSTDTCPDCAADLTGAPIPAEHRQHYGTATHFSRRIGVSDGDSVGYWRCPDCGHEWPRDGGIAAMARRNIDHDRAVRCPDV